MSSKSGQLEINETILVLIIFSVLAIISIVVFYKFNAASIDATILDSQRVSFHDLLNQVPNTPELKCTSQNIQDDDCVDLLKLFGFSKHQSNYVNKLGAKIITITIIYPELPDKECTEQLFQASNFPNCNKIIVYKNEKRNPEAVEKVSSPIAIYNPLNQEYMLGLLEVEWQY